MPSTADRPVETFNESSAVLGLLVSQCALLLIAPQWASATVVRPADKHLGVARRSIVPSFAAHIDRGLAVSANGEITNYVGHRFIRIGGFSRWPCGDPYATLMARRACVVALAFQCFSGSPGLQAVASQDEGSGIAEIAAGGDEEDT